jgi:hypothetical protein
MGNPCTCNGTAKKETKRKVLRDLRMIRGAAFALALGLPLIYPVNKKK